MEESPLRLEPGDEPLSLVEKIDRLIASLPPGDPIRGELIDVRVEVADMEDMTVEARRTIEKLDAVVKKLSSPANRIGTFLVGQSSDTALIVVGGSDYLCNVDPRVEMRSLRRGSRVLVTKRSRLWATSVSTSSDRS
jgi:proteasome-associated ATPase